MSPVPFHCYQSNQLKLKIVIQKVLRSNWKKKNNQNYKLFRSSRQGEYCILVQNYSRRKPIVINVLINKKKIFGNKFTRNYSRSKECTTKGSYKKAVINTRVVSNEFEIKHKCPDKQYVE